MAPEDLYDKIQIHFQDLQGLPQSDSCQLLFQLPILSHLKAVSPV